MINIEFTSFTPTIYYLYSPIKSLIACCLQMQQECTNASSVKLKYGQCYRCTYRAGQHCVNVLCLGQRNVKYGGSRGGSGSTVWNVNKYYYFQRWQGEAILENMDINNVMLCYMMNHPYVCSLYCSIIIS